MALDPKKLALMVEEQNKNPMTVGSEMSSTDDTVDMEDIPEEESEGADLGEFGDELIASADALVPIAEEIGEDLAGDSEYSDDTKDAIEEAVDRMPDHIQEGLVDIADIPKEDLMEISKQMVEEVDTAMTPAGEAEPEEVEMVAGLLDAASTCCAEINGENEEEEPEEEEDLEEYDEEEM